MLDTPIDVKRPMRSLSATERAIVGLARAVSVQGRTLGSRRADSGALRIAMSSGSSQSSGGCATAASALIYVTHRIDEVFELADRVSVLRNGRMVATEKIAEVTPASLVAHILGRPLTELFVEPPTPSREVVLEVRGLVSGSVGPVSFKVHAGEVVGLVGRIGAGHDIVGRAIYGALKLAEGDVFVAGESAGGNDRAGAAGTASSLPQATGPKRAWPAS